MVYLHKVIYAYNVIIPINVDSPHVSHVVSKFNRTIGNLEIQPSLNNISNLVVTKFIWMHR